jgi:DNA-binding NtrC family response regulator
MLHAIIVDDDPTFGAGLAELVGREGFTTSTATSLSEARLELARKRPDVLLLDLQLPDGSGLDLLREIEEGVSPEVIFITGHASLETAVEALRQGGADYLTKPVDFARVKMVLANVARTRELKQEIGTLRGELRRLGRFGALIGGSPAMQKVYDLIAKVAPTEATVLLLGETGTGKELAAQTIHSLSRRVREPFIPVNCGAVPATLIESELFGHERGSFTGAERIHRGYFERAHRGTLFLDEITEMPADLQVKLLRVLETRTVRRVGGSEEIKADVRIIAASNREPVEAVADGKLREDLLYRLNVFPIQLPPLRERKEDIELLAEHFLAGLNGEQGDRKPKGVSRAALERLRSHGWPGNVRELKNVLARAFILADEDISLDCLPLGVTEETTGSSLVMKVGTSIAEAERRLILATVEHCEGDKKKASRILQVSVKTLYNRLNVYKG